MYNPEMMPKLILFLILPPNFLFAGTFVLKFDSVF